MPLSARHELVQAKNVLLRRRDTTVDAAERAIIDAALSELNDSIEAIDMVSLLEAAGLVARATDALERVVASARMAPFDSFLADIQGAMDGLQRKLDEMHASERLAPAPLEALTVAEVPAAAVAPAPAAPAATVVASAPVAAPVAPARTPMVAPPVGVPTPVNSKNFSDLRDEYARMFDLCRLRPQFASNVEFYVSRLIKHRLVYQQLGQSLGIPWVFIGVIHGMECGFNFGTHLHNGDPLSRRTVRVPKGRPASGQPPFAWLDSARDALVMKKLDHVGDWNLPRILFLLEAYNGFGYRPRGVPTPYLWSFSNQYERGKYVADGVFDPQAVSKQCGAAVMLRVLQERGVV